MNRKNRFLLLIAKFILLFALCFLGLVSMSQNTISLAGKWSVDLDSADVGIRQQWYKKTFSSILNLPGTLDDAGIGTPTTLNADKLTEEILLHLTRKHSYIGPAWYSRTINIPKDWKGRDIELELERVIWKTRLWIDGKEVGSQESLSVPQRFELGTLLAPGKHTLVFRIDNTKQYDISIRNLAHAYTDGTQIIWNGVIGQMKLTARDKVQISSLQVYPNVKNRSISVITYLLNKADRNQRGTIHFQVLDQKNRVISRKIVDITIENPGSKNFSEISLGKNAPLWDEFDPNLYTLRAKLDLRTGPASDVASTRFGLREITADNGLIQLNGRRIFLRGTLECSIFPLTGHPPMDKEGWIKVFSSAKNYGLNHLRFHSWCPPGAAFEVADSMGFYLQVELPLWNLNVGKDTATNRFITEEALRISQEYGNHPSFCLWSLGNELEGDFGFLSSLLNELKRLDDRHLYTTTSFSFQKGHGTWPEPNDDFLITQYTKKGWVRGQGIFNSYAPDFSLDYKEATDSLPVPLITHEIGQYSVYPNMHEIKKYTGVLDPLNFKAIHNDLKRKNLLSLADSFTLASGRFSANLYKEEIERALKTKNISGFQLLDLHDFPGQGTALVGILDAFWDSKGLIAPDAHRMYCAPVVPLIRFKKAVYTNDEILDLTVEVANFSKQILRKVTSVVTVKDQSGKVFFKRALSTVDIGIGNNWSMGKLRIPLNTFIEAKALTIEVELKGTSYKNSWKIWVYPSRTDTSDSNVIFTTSPADAIRFLDEGKKVLLNPDTSIVAGVAGRFAPVFWSPVHFPNQPGTMGILCNPRHPVFNSFPTDFYTDWQWWDLIASSKTMLIDSLPAIDPIVRVIDNFFKNRKMANIIEARVGKGKVILTSLDLTKNLDKRPAARQLRLSIIRYMEGDSFSPSTALRPGDLEKILNK